MSYQMDNRMDRSYLNRGKSMDMSFKMNNNVEYLKEMEMSYQMGNQMDGSYSNKENSMDMSFKMNSQ
mgnify:CR=1 FL=1